MSVRIGSPAEASAAGSSPAVLGPATESARFSVPGALPWPPIAWPDARGLTLALRPMILPSRPTGKAGGLCARRSRPRSVLPVRDPALHVRGLLLTPGRVASPPASSAYMRHYRRCIRPNHPANRANGSRVLSLLGLLADGPPRPAWPGPYVTVPGLARVFLAVTELAVGNMLRASAWRMLLHKPDHAVLIAAPAVDHAGHAASGVGEQEEIVTHELHLEQRLVDGHRHRGVELLPYHQGAGALRVDLDFPVLVLGRLRRGVACIGGIRGSGHRGGGLPTVAGQEPAAAPESDSGQLSVGRQVSLGQIGQPDGRARPVPAFPPVAQAPQARFQLVECQVERGEPVVRSGLGANRGPA